MRSLLVLAKQANGLVLSQNSRLVTDGMANTDTENEQKIERQKCFKMEKIILPSCVDRDVLSDC